MSKMIGKYTEDFLRSQAIGSVKDKTKNSEILSVEQEDLVPRFQSAELTIGNELGRGGFASVFEIKKVALIGEVITPPQNNSIDDDSEEGDYSCPNINLQDRHFIATKYIRSGKGASNSRYAIKTMRKDITDPSRFLGGVMDLAIETRFLAVIRHPNIIKMRATSSIDSSQPNYFIILDRLYDTLTERIAVWKGAKKKTTGFHKVRDLNGDKKKAMWVDRVLVAHNLCSALSYLHRNRIVYRDLKPDNIGFDVRGDVKLFDFGLARELAPQDQMDCGVYNLSGETGSLRYMAPEVAKGRPYNMTVDVYSFSILLWQICSLVTPFENLNKQTHHDQVVLGNVRPPINPSWPKELSTVMSNGWSEDMTVRPDCSHIMDVLRTEMNPFLDDMEVDALDHSNRTAASLKGS